jgi:asparagine synthase (glutamine-hydrolysing)
VHTRWFGGHIGNGSTMCTPTKARLLWTSPPLWVAGSWPPRHVRIAYDHPREVIIVIGACSAEDDDLRRLLGRDIPRSALTAWAGAYTIIHLRENKATILTDISGACPIYTTQDHSGGVVWGSSSRALASLSGGRVDDKWLASRLADPFIATVNSGFTHVKMVPPGHRLTIIRGQIRDRSNLWEPTSLAWADSIERIRNALKGAVHVRVADVAASADLSGGLDSTTLAALAAETGPIAAITMHPANVTTGGDMDHAQAAVTSNQNLRHVLLPLNDSHLPFTGLDTLPATDEPAPSSLVWSMLSAELRLLRELGIHSHITGDGGDTLFLPPPVYLTDLARRGQWLRVLHEAQGWARLRRSSPWPLLTTAFSGAMGLAANDSAISPGWLTDHARRLATTSERVVSSLELNHADQDLIARTRYAARSAHAEIQLADHFGIAMHNPYLDGAILDAVIAVDGPLRGSPRRYKPLLNAVAANILPPTVRNRGTKGVFVGEHHQGIRRNLRSTLLLADGRLAERGLVSPRHLESEILAAAAGAKIHWGHLKRFLSTELWLRAVEKSTPVGWTMSGTLMKAA